MATQKASAGVNSRSMTAHSRRALKSRVRRKKTVLPKAVSTTKLLTIRRAGLYSSSTLK